MAVTTKYILQTVVIAGVQINQIKDVEVSPQISRMFEYGSGTVDPTFAGFDSEEPVLRFTTTAIKKLLSVVDVNAGVAITTSPAATAVFYFQQTASGGTRQTGATGFSITVGLGIAVISRISAGDGQVATADCLVYALSTDGETAPLAYATGVTLPALAATDQLYTVGPAYTNNVAVGAVESFDFDPKISVRRNRGDGEAYPTYTFIMRRGSEGDGPTITITTRNLNKAAAGSAVAIASSTRVFLRSLKAGALRETLASLKHIQFVANSGSVIVNSLGGRDGDEGMLSLDISAVATTSLPAFSITSDVAIA